MASSRIFNSAPWLWLLLLLAPLLPAESSWEQVRHDEERGIFVYQRSSASSEFDAIYARTTVTASKDTVLAVLMDFRAMPQWFARVKTASASPDGRRLSIRYELPYPFKARHAELLLSKTTHNDGSIELLAISNARAKAPDAVIALKESRNRWRISEKEPGKTTIELWGESQPGGLIPALLYNYNVADDALQTMKQLRRMLLRPQYQTKAAENPS